MVNMSDISFVVNGHWFDGVLYPGVVSRRMLEYLPSAETYDDDIIVAGYPKSGEQAYMNINHYTLNLSILIKNSFNFIVFACHAKQRIFCTMFEAA